MKTRTSFVSNSSSCSFIITNKTEQSLSIGDFARENINLLLEYYDRYGWEKDNLNYDALKNFLESADDLHDEPLLPGNNYITFGDEQGTAIGRIYDYILRDGGKSARFSWTLDEILR